MDHEYHKGYLRGRFDENKDIGKDILSAAEAYRKQDKYSEYHLLMDLYRKINRYGY